MNLEKPENMNLLKPRKKSKNGKKNIWEGRTIYLQPEDWKKLEEKGDEMGLKLSPYIRFLLKQNGHI